MPSIYLSGPRDDVAIGWVGDDADVAVAVQVQEASLDAALELVERAGRGPPHPVSEHVGSEPTHVKQELVHEKHVLADLVLLRPLPLGGRDIIDVVGLQLVLESRTRRDAGHNELLQDRSRHFTHLKFHSLPEQKRHSWYQRQIHHRYRQDDGRLSL